MVPDNNKSVRESRQVDLPRLLAAARDLLARPGRHVIAIAGAPGSGKSTLVDDLARKLDDAEPGLAAVVGMDGFHFDNGVLESRGRRPWKGAPDTFDVGGLLATLRRLRDPAEGEVVVPVFDRELEISRGSAKVVEPGVRLILVEGNYLLLDEAPWKALAELFDLTVMVEVPEPELTRRLRRRWEGHGLSEAEIDFRLEQNDLPNGRTVAARSAAAALTYILK